MAELVSSQQKRTEEKRLSIRYYYFFGWALCVVAALYIYFFYPELIKTYLGKLFLVSVYVGYLCYLILVCIRGLTLIPSTYFIVLGLLFFSPLPLYILTIIGILVSSTSVYFFSRFLRVDEFLKKKHGKHIVSARALLEKNELPIIIAWSAAPFLATDIICYVCGALRVNYAKFILGVFIGEGITCAVYVFFGQYILQQL
jgi:uncharacterized membrane protein YdjX (TVP38/TMEM64 family)